MQVEGVLLAHPAVVQAAAFGIENQVMGEMVHAAVTLTPGLQVSHQIWLLCHHLCPCLTAIIPCSMHDRVHHDECFWISQSSPGQRDEDMQSLGLTW